MTALRFLLHAWLGASWALAWAPSAPRSRLSRRSSIVMATDRRTFVGAAGAAAFGVLSAPNDAFAEVVPKGGTVLVAGATGATGGRVLTQLLEGGGVSVIGGVRNTEKAQKLFGSTGAKFVTCDVTASLESLVQSCTGVDAVICAVGFVPGSPFGMKDQAHLVDNLGTKRLVDACVQAKVKKVVLVSSILTNGRAWGQEKSPGFVVTNAFGGVLDEKIEAENYLRASGLDYTIVRPGGLKAKPPTGELQVFGEDKLNSGEVSRDLVASVCIEALFSPQSKNKVVEIIEGEGSPKISKDKWFAV